MKRLLSFSFLLLSSFVSAQNRVEPLVAVKVADSKFQFVNRQTGIPASPQLWDETEPFMNGYARVFLNNKFSFVNDKATLISPVVFEGARNFSNNLAAVKKDGKWGFINGSGKIIFPFRYTVIFDFEGTVSVGFENKKWWLINNNGEAIKQLDISVCYGFKNGVAKINKDGRNGKMNANGDITFDPPSAQNKKPIIYNPAPDATAAACPDNIDFENGDFTNWECFTGVVDSVGTTNVITVTPSPPTPNRHDLVPRIMPSALDPYGLFPTNPPDGSNFAVKLGNTNVGAEAERIRYTIRVPVNDTNFTIKYDYAVVLEDPGHTIWTQPRFNAKLLDSATNTYIQCASFEYISTSNLPGFQVSSVDPAVIFKDWSSVFFSLRGYGGKTVYLEFTTADCVRRAHWGYAYVDVETPCDQDIQMEYDCDFPNITTLTAPPGFQTYNWWNQNYTTLLGTGQQVVLNPGPAVNTIIWLEMIPFANFGCTDTLMAKITGNLNAQFDMSSASGCAPHTFTFYNRNLPSTTTVWDFGDGTFGTGDTVTHTYSTPGTYTVTLNVTVLSGCNGTATHQVHVSPIPDMVQPPNLNVCNTASTNTIIFSGSVTGTTFTWTNDNTAIGLPASGNGNIPSFTATNATNAVISATITVTPTAAGCPGPPETFTINVRPTASVVQPPDQILCNGAATNAVIMSGSLPLTLFTWTNDNTSIGLAAGGNGNIPSFNAVNTTNAPVTATIIITPSTGGCPGAPQSFTITVNPTADIAPPPHQNLCNGTATNTIAFSGSVANTTYTWTNNNTLIGLGAAGNGNIPSFIAANATNVPDMATITVTPSAAGCAGTPGIFTITVKPSPDVVQLPGEIVCNGVFTTPVTFTGSVSGTSFAWENNNNSIGLAASGNGNIPSFRAVNTSNMTEVAAIRVTPSAAGCTGTPQVFYIVVKPTPDVTQPPNQVLCNSNLTNQVIFTGSVSGTTYNWSNTSISIGLPGTGTGNIAPFMVHNTNNSVSVATITVRPIALGCQGPYKTFTITINPAPNVMQPPSQTLCNGVVANMTALTGNLSGITFNWSNNNPSIGLAASGTGDVPAFTATNTGNAPITATITVTPSTAVCPGAAKTFTITVAPTPSVAASNDMNVCLGNTAQLSATGASQYYWTPSTRLSCANCPNPVSTPVDSIRYVVRGESSAGCTAYDTVFLNVIRPFQMTISPNDTLCIGETTDLRANGANIYLWSPPTGLSSSHIAEPIASPAVTTTYQVVGYDGHNCFTDTSTVKITVGPKPTLDIGPDLSLSTGNTIQFNPVYQNGPIVSWSWTPATGLSCTNCPKPTVTVKDNMSYMLTIKNNYGCVTTDIININVFCKSAQVFIPNAFTPDGDGLNDILMVRGKGIIVKTFRIFSRWGELVFEKKDFAPNDLKYGWDGKVRGVPATPDVFVYTAEVICDNNVIYTYKGNTTLLK